LGFSGKAENLSGLRGLLEDLLAPRVGRLDARVEFLSERCEKLADEIRETREAHQALLAHLNEQLTVLHGRLGKLEGRADGLKSELTAAVQIEIFKMAQRAQGFPGGRQESLLPSSLDPASE
jgi:predicted nuclease with TOPRIM domain